MAEKQKKYISLLIGSGFSFPADYPTTTKLNERLRKIELSEICVHTSRDAFFLNGQTDLNSEWMGVEQRYFVQEFLEFYRNRILKDGEQFHYETFYDYYITPYLTDEYSDDLHTFLKDFKHRHRTVTDLHHMLMEFNDIFSQLLAQLLTKKIERVHLCKPLPLKYNLFLSLIEKLSETHKIHIHTLNHDVYFESLSLTDSIQGRLDDGFDDLGSPIFAKKDEKFASYMVRLRRFTNKYDEPFCLYKLHGSIDNYWASFEDNSSLVKIPYGISAHEIHIEVSKEGNLQYVHSPSDVVPDFLSGTTHKISRYQKGSYYPVVLEHFQNNLRNSKALIVIGYGFSDLRINQYIIDCFLNDPNKTMFVVDVVRPEAKILNRSNIYFDVCGVSDMQTGSILQRIEN